MRGLGLILVMVIGATIAVYTPLKDLYPPRHQIFALAVETVPELSDYIPSWLTVPPEMDETLAPVVVVDESENTEITAAVTEPNELTEATASSVADESLWTGFEPEPLRLLLDEMGFSAEVSVSDEEEEMLLVNRSTGLDFALVLKSCDRAQDESGCDALQVAAIIFQDMDDGVVASMNRRHDAMKFAKMDGGDLQITRYVTAEHGIARDNVKANIQAFVDILDLYMGTG